MPAIEAGCEPGGVPSRGTLQRIGAILKVQVGLDPGEGPQDLPRLREHRWTALVDTGADVSCIDVNVAGRLGLPVVREDGLSGVSGSIPVEVYAAQLVVPDLNTTLSVEFLGAPLRERGRLFDVILGRDFLSDYNMNYDGPSGSVIISSPNSQR